MYRGIEANYGQFSDLEAYEALEFDDRGVAANMLEFAFDELPDAAREVLVNGRSPLNNLEGRTLENIGDEFGLTRERIRQLKNNGRKRLAEALDRIVPAWETNLRLHLENTKIINALDFADRLCAPHGGVAYVLIMLEKVGWEPVPNHTTYWVADGKEFTSNVNAFKPTGPITETEWQELCGILNIPSTLLDDYAFKGVGRMIRYGENRIRESEQRTDEITVFLRKEGEASADEIACQLSEDLKANTLSEYMRRKGVFSQNPITGKWGLKGQVDHYEHESAQEAVFHLLTTEGPISFKHLSQRMSMIFPVTPWRVRQILDDYRIGTMTDGKYWLIERGAKRPPEKSRKQPENMVVKNNTIGIAISINRDHLRGSGSMFNGWLCVNLGLKATPFDMTFTNPLLQDLVISRTGGSTTIGSLAKATQLVHFLKGAKPS